MKKCYVVLAGLVFAGESTTAYSSFSLRIRSAVHAVFLVTQPSNPDRVHNWSLQLCFVYFCNARAQDACSSTACRLEASVTAPPTNMYSCPVEICVFGKARSPSHELLQHHMRRRVSPASKTLLGPKLLRVCIPVLPQKKSVEVGPLVHNNWTCMPEKSRWILLLSMW